MFVSKGAWSTLSVYPGRRVKVTIGIAIPRALFPRSTSRNRLRRQIREAIRILQNEKGLAFETQARGGDLLIRVKKEESPPFKTIQQEMEVHLRRLEAFQ